MPTIPEEIRIGGLAIRFLVDGTASGGSVAIFELDVEPAARVPIAHSHDAYEETIYGLEGTLTLTLSGEPRQIGPGDAVLIPRGAVHRFDNLHPTRARTLCVVSPGILGPAYFREIADLLRTAAQAGTPPNPAAIGEIMRRHGLTPAP
jgi:quercetin dioxygenase-like cupin family protein